MRRKISFVSIVVTGVALATGILMILFFLTKGVWYDTSLDVPARVSFWNEALVAYGTLALAIVTVASVWETQQVIKGEDLRFRQTRMPMLKIVALRPESTQYRVAISNVGEGAAREIKIDFKAEVEWKWSDQGFADNRDKKRKSSFNVRRQFTASYLEPDGSIEALVEAMNSEGDEAAMMPNPLLTNSVLDARIEYRDVFGSYYVTDYALSAGGVNLALESFIWNTPPDLGIRSDWDFFEVMTEGGRVVQVRR